MQSTAVIVEQALRLAEITRGKSILFRLFGSCAVFIKCDQTQAILRENNRVVKDIDAIVLRRHLHAFRELIRKNGWNEQIEVTALTDGSRLRLSSKQRDITLDVAVDRLRFNQTLELESRLSLDWPAISNTDLLLSKFQIADASTNDLVDMAALLTRFEIAAADESQISLERICDLCRSSWRWYRAVIETCTKLGDNTLVESIVLSSLHASTVARRADQIRQAVESVSKPLAWKARRLIGDRIPWITHVESF
jgi:hypothetical protein